MNIITSLSEVEAVLDARRKAFLDGVRAKGLDLPSAAFLRGAVYRAGSGLALDAPPGVEDVSEAAMTATFVISTPRKDRMGDVVVPRGCEKHLTNFAANPRVFLNHRSSGLPVGSARDEAGNLTVKVLEDRILSTVHFHGQTPESVAVFALVAAKELEASSIGFLPVKASIIKADDEEDGPRKTADGEKIIAFDGWFPLRFLEWDLSEWSVVGVPANPDAISMHLSRGHVGGEKITPALRKALEPFALRARVWSPGFDPQKVQYTGDLKMGDTVLSYAAGALCKIDDVELAPKEEPAKTPQDQMLADLEVAGGAPPEKSAPTDDAVTLHDAGDDPAAGAHPGRFEVRDADGNVTRVGTVDGPAPGDTVSVTRLLVGEVVTKEDLLLAAIARLTDTIGKVMGGLSERLDRCLAGVDSLVGDAAAEKFLSAKEAREKAAEQARLEELEEAFAKSWAARPPAVVPAPPPPPVVPPEVLARLSEALAKLSESQERQNKALFRLTGKKV